MSVNDLQLGTERAWKLAYGWRSIAARLLHSPAPWHVRLITNFGYRFYAHNLHRFYNCDWILGFDRGPSVADEEIVPLTISGAGVR
jgi:hypothetical protein